jgi:hypothetical protein
MLAEPKDEASPLFANQSSSTALPTVNPVKSLFVDSRLSVGDAIGGTGDEYNRPDIAPLGVP